MRGNPYSRGGDPMMSRREKRNMKKAKLAKTGRVQRLKKRLTGIHQRKVKHEGNVHTTALMESYIVRRKEARAAEKKAAEAEEAKKAADANNDSNVNNNNKEVQTAKPMQRNPPATDKSLPKKSARQPARPVTRSLY